MTKVIKSILFFIVFGLLLCGKNNSSHSQIQCQDICIQTKRAPGYKRDSALLSYTIHGWVDSSYGWYGHYNKRNALRGLYKPHVGCIFYDTQMLKLTAFVYVEYNIEFVDTINRHYTNDTSHFFDSHTVMGVRNSLQSPWKFYELNEIFMGLGSRSLEKAKNLHHSIFLNKSYLQDSAFVTINNVNGGHQLQAVEYLPCEKEFFFTSPIWKKGERYPGYYLFETYHNTTAKSNRPLRPWVSIKYPDSLIMHYRDSLKILE